MVVTYPTAVKPPQTIPRVELEFPRLVLVVQVSIVLTIAGFQGNFAVMMQEA
jgi:hypothetical protein